MSTTSTTNIYRTLRTRLLSFTPAAGATLASRLGNRLFVAQAPDDATYPYGVMTLSLSTEGAYNGDREQGIFEVTLYDRAKKHSKTSPTSATERCCDMRMRVRGSCSAGTGRAPRYRLPRPRSTEKCAPCGWPTVSWCGRKP